VIKFILTFLSTCACLQIQAQVNIITTIAGKDSAGYDGDGIPATNAKLHFPYQLCIDNIGTILIADAFNNRIRRINSIGIINSIAGNGIAGFSGDSGLAIDAKLGVPVGIVIDTMGNYYISDGLNHRIRKVNSSGIITTLVGTGIAGNSGDGGLSTDAQIDGPSGLCLHGEYLYISDYTSQTIREVSLLTGVINTIAGSGVAGYFGDGGIATNAKLKSPSDVYADNDGNIYIADNGNAVIRKVNKNTGIITTVVGTGIVGYAGDGDLGINAKLNQPAGVFIDKQNDIYIAEYGNGAVRKVDAISGIITTVAGTGIAGFGGDGGPATNAKLFCSDVWVDKYGNLIIADYENNRIRKVNNAVAVNGISKEVESKLYPNPTTGVFTIQTPINISFVSVYNIAGISVYERTCTTTETEIDISSQPSGVYIVYVQYGDKLYVSKVIKQ
jgi:hypothetical protein